MLKEGLNIGLVTDQGTPIISDPGFIISRGVIEAGFNVISLPACSILEIAVLSLYPALLANSCCDHPNSILFSLIRSPTLTPDNYINQKKVGIYHSFPLQDGPLA